MGIRSLPKQVSKSFVLLVCEKNSKRGQEFPASVLPQLSGRRHARQTAPDTSWLRAKTPEQTDAQTGLPHPEHGGGLGSPGNPRFPSEPARHRVPTRGFYQEQAKGP